MRLQLALNVPDLEAAIVFYEKLFSVTVAKRKPGYANFEISQPALKLVLFESESSDRLNHLGVEVFNDQAVDDVAAHLKEVGLATTRNETNECCFALQNKVFTHAPDGTMWEWYRKIQDTQTIKGLETPKDAEPTPQATCC
tara:strand:+ start:3070 stop:3492 length:423 start_codon:yes stop_codon:yes gene_type:complete